MPLFAVGLLSLTLDLNQGDTFIDFLFRLRYETHLSQFLFRPIMESRVEFLDDIPNFKEFKFKFYVQNCKF